MWPSWGLNPDTLGPRAQASILSTLYTSLKSTFGPTKIFAHFSLNRICFNFFSHPPSRPTNFLSRKALQASLGSVSGPCPPFPQGPITLPTHLSELSLHSRRVRHLWLWLCSRLEARHKGKATGFEVTENLIRCQFSLF